jgi:hypothetical protein
MKALSTTILLVFATVFNASAQFDITVNPIFAVIGTYQVSIEHTTKDAWSIGLDASWGDELYDKEGSRYAFLMGRHYFFPTKKNNRLYATAFAGVVNAIVYDRYVSNGNTYFAPKDEDTFGYGFGAGYKFVSNKKIIFDLAAGIGRGNDVFPHFKVSMGYRFNNKTS